MWKVVRRTLFALAALVCLLGLGLGALHALDRTRSVADPAQVNGAFDVSDLLVIVDADMAATAYADGLLLRTPGEADALMIFAARDGGTALPTEPDALVQATVPAPNSVMGWPGALAVHPSGRWAYVVETRGAPEDGVQQVTSVHQDMSWGRRLTTVDIQDPAAPRVLATLSLPASPTSIQAAPNGNWLLVATYDPDQPVLVVTLVDGEPDEIRPIALPLPILTERPRDTGVLYARVAPDGRRLAMNLANTHVFFGTFDLDEAGVPMSADLIDASVPTDGWITMGRWSADSRFYLAADTGWGPSRFDAVLNGAGRVVSIAFDETAPRIVSDARTSLSPEGFAMSADGAYLAVVNMERTYLPGGLPTALLPRRHASSLSLVRFDADSGGLTTLGDPVFFRGVLPEDAVFDDDGDQVAVVIYQDHDDPRSDGWIEFFAVDRSRPEPALVPTGRRIPTPRGAHDLHAVY